MTLKPQLAGAGESQRAIADRSAAAVHLDSFVINLCSSTTPMALAQPDTPELKRFKFFVSRRLEDGRERFRLHMGHFESLEEAEDWLSVVRDVYPGAWAGETPGKRLRARAAPTVHAAMPQAPGAPQVEPAAVKLPPAVALPSAREAPRAAPVPAAVLAAPSAAPAATPSTASVAPTPAIPPARPAQMAAAASASVAPRAPVPTPARHDTDAVVSAAAMPRRASGAPLSNVREVLAALDERDSKPGKPSAAARGATSAPPTPASLTDTQVMQILEARRTEKSPAAAAHAVPDGIALLRPDDSGTRRALKEAVQDNAAVAFAVQLQSAAEPLALEKVPPLAIFSAYTLYTVEGTRAGRAWYGLRLGFFADASAAKQVAHYVRSDFAAVAVVPVSHIERERAARREHTTAAASPSHSAPAPVNEEIPLFEVESAEPPRVSVKQAGGGAHTGSAAARAASARSKKRRAEATVAEIVKAERTLEETLEILGAGTLEIDNGRGEFINEAAVRRPSEVRKNSPFQRLLARLTERVRRS